MVQSNLEQTETVLDEDDDTQLVERITRYDGDEKTEYFVRWGTATKDKRLFDGDHAQRAARIYFELRKDDMTTTSSVPTAVAVEGKPAVAAYLYQKFQENTEGSVYERVADRMGVSTATARNYLSRFLSDT